MSGRRKTAISTRLYSAFVLTSSVEDPERFMDPGSSSIGKEGQLSISQEVKSLQWIDPTIEVADVEVKPNDESLPLYPLSAVYLPDPTVNHTLRNVEPRNIQMALDLEASSSVPMRFCVVLRATDTGRLASVGTVLRVLDMEKQCSAFSTTKDASDCPIKELDRIVLTCQAEPDLVNVIQIENPAAARQEQRLRKSSEYLRAIVRPQSSEEGSSADASNLQELCRQAEVEYDQVQELYQNNSTSSDLPPFALNRLSEAFALPMQEFNNDKDNDDETRVMFASPESFWRVASAWQTLCNTVREGHQMTLNGNRNEVLVAAAMKQGGPLKLPIHVEDVDPSIRRLVTEMEAQAQRDWWSRQLDPCLDFQALLALPSHVERVKYLTNMMQRERKRFVAKMEELEESSDEREAQMLYKNVDELLRATESAQPETPKGAWFNDDYW